MNSTRITGDDTSRVSMCVGLSVAVVLIVGVLYLVFASHALTSETGFDPNRAVPSNSVLRSRLKPDQYHVTRENGTETAFQNRSRKIRSSKRTIVLTTCIASKCAPSAAMRILDIWLSIPHRQPDNVTQS